MVRVTVGCHDQGDVARPHEHPLKLSPEGFLVVWEACVNENRSALTAEYKGVCERTHMDAMDRHGCGGWQNRSLTMFKEVMKGTSFRAPFV